MSNSDMGGELLRIPVLGVGFDNLTMTKAVDRAFEIMNTGGYIVTPNPEIVMTARKDSSYRDIINSADIVVPDGIGIIYGAKILGHSLFRIPGIDLASEIIKKLAEKGGSVYLFGAKPGVAEMAAEKLAAEYKGLVIAGTSHGYFEDSTPIIENINVSKPDLLLVCIGAPRQEQWMHENMEKLPKCLMMGLGGALDVYSGVTKRAPKVFRRLGLEWFFRLVKQPSRLFRMLKLPIFLVLVLAERLRGTKNTAEESNNG